MPQAHPPDTEELTAAGHVPAWSGWDLEGAVEDLGVHEPLMSYPSGFDSERDWREAIDAMIAARLLRP
jgi:hypothetical protein